LPITGAAIFLHPKRRSSHDNQNHCCKHAQPQPGTDDSLSSPAPSHVTFHKNNLLFVLLLLKHKSGDYFLRFD
jgi:hypothetical protein